MTMHRDATARPKASRLRRCLPLVLAVLASGALAAEEDELFFKDIGQVNEGELRFLTALPDKPVHHFRNHIRIGPDSLASGWVGLEQCHANLDAVPRAQIVYGKERIRNLRLESSENVGKAWVEGGSVQMEDVAPNARLCLSGETRALTLEDGEYVLRNGPYMRKFLDGYYPMRVSMTVTLETNRLAFVDSEPAPQPGFVVWQKEGQVGYEAAFEGELRTLLRFRVDAPPVTGGSAP